MRLISFICLSIFVTVYIQGQELWLDDLPIQTYSEGLRPVIAKQSYIKDTIRLQGQIFSRGLGQNQMYFILNTPFGLNQRIPRVIDVRGRK